MHLLGMMNPNFGSNGGRGMVYGWVKEGFKCVWDNATGSEGFPQEQSRYISYILVPSDALSLRF